MFVKQPVYLFNVSLVPNDLFFIEKWGKITINTLLMLINNVRPIMEVI